jgi:hypothetical protein
MLLCIRYKPKEIFPIIFLCFAVISLLAITEGNVGALFRHKEWIMPFILSFSAIGLLKVFYPSKLDCFQQK